jgi:ligand-binding SRPBCC domain-containing protein
MPILKITTIIKAPTQRVFDLSRSIDLHKISTASTNEEAVAGITTGLIGLSETITWQAVHLFKQRKMTVKITEMEAPHYFKDEMLEGDFKLFQHQHYFKPIAETTEMTDILAFQSPFGWLGKLVDVVFMKRYLTHFLTLRNNTIKQFAEGEDCKKLFVN